MAHNFKKISPEDVLIAARRHTETRYGISAAKPFALWQSFSLGIIIGLLCAGLVYYRDEAFIVIGTCLIFIFGLLLGLKIIIFFLEIFYPLRAYSPSSILSDDMLPVYTVMVPLFKEGKSLPSLLEALSAIEYPREKYEIFLLLEENDDETMHSFIGCQNNFKDLNITVFTLPAGLPQTKPKALNAALPYVTGEYLTIYDAEDCPDVMQLKKSASSFYELPANVAALQARLTYYNARTNILTKLFTVEYDIWFHHYLNGLMRLKLPIPLAGTSTHFRTIDVHRIGGWDAFNVTEDCDLGMRFTKANLETVMLDSDTYEEATINCDAWFKQRTRWLKGYMQTQFVHSARLFHNISQFGIYRFLGMCTVVGGQVLLAFLYPVAIFSFLYHVVADIFFWEPFLHPKLVPLTYIMLFLGIGMPTIQSILVYMRLKDKKYLLPISLLHPLYWCMASFASYRAMWQLVTAPSYWEKTPHGLDIDNKKCH